MVLREKLKILFLQSRIFHLLLLCLFCIFYFFYGIGDLEFFRHTEADRGLIALEMVENGTYFVPKLLGSEILTKPPLYYWLVAGAIKSFKAFDPFTLRFTSALLGSLLVVIQYFFFIRMGFSRFFALFSAFTLGAGGQYWILAKLAEIDMTFVFFSTVSLYLLFLSYQERTKTYLFIAYIFLSLSFSTKGVQSLAIFFITLGGLVLYNLFAEKRNIAGKLKFLFFELVKNVLGLAIFLVVIGLWLIPLEEQMSWQIIYEQYKNEVQKHIFTDSAHERGTFFYLRVLLVALLPWSLFYLSMLLPNFYKEFRHGFKRSSDKQRQFFLFNLLILLPGLLMLTFASGKANRYFFPLYPFAINFILCTYTFLVGSYAEKKVFDLTKFFLALFLSLAILVSPILVLNINTSAILVGIGIITSLFYFVYQKNYVMSFISVYALSFFVNFSYVHYFVPLKNSEKSVRNIASKINFLVPQGESIYTLEMFDRWVIYYLKGHNRRVQRISRDNQYSLKSISQDVYVLLNVEEESWRLRQLEDSQQPYKLLWVFNDGDTKLILISIMKESAYLFHPQKNIPIIPSPEFYDIRCLTYR